MNEKEREAAKARLQQVISEQLRKSMFSAEQALEGVDLELAKKNLEMLQQHKEGLLAACDMASQIMFMRFSSYVKAGFTEEQALFLVSK